MKDILAERDRILREAGFEDIEASGTDAWLKGDRRSTFDPARTTEYEAAERYHALTRTFLEHHAFTSELERDVWQAHADGASFTEIAERFGIARSRGVRIVFRLSSLCFAGNGARRGRKPDPHGYSRDAFELSVKLNPPQTDALDYIARTLGVDHRMAIRAAILAQAKHLQSAK